MTEKLFITANDLLADSFRLARMVLDDGFRPDFIVGLWRGGAPVGIAVQEFLAHNGVVTDHIAIRTSSYAGMARRAGAVRVHGLHYIVDNAKPGDAILLVDDTFDTGRSVAAVIDAILAGCGASAPRDIKTAVVYDKPTRHEVDFAPDWRVHETDKWLVFPHELRDLSDADIRAHKPAAAWDEIRD